VTQFFKEKEGRSGGKGGGGRTNPEEGGRNLGVKPSVKEVDAPNKKGHTKGVKRMVMARVFPREWTPLVFENSCARRYK